MQNILVQAQGPNQQQPELIMSSCDCFQAGEEETGDFTKEVLTMWKVSVVEGERCTAPKAGRKGSEAIPFLFTCLDFNSLLSIRCNRTNTKQQQEHRQNIQSIKRLKESHKNNGKIAWVWSQTFFFHSTGETEGLKSQVEKTQVGVAVCCWDNRYTMLFAPWQMHWLIF